MINVWFQVRWSRSVALISALSLSAACPVTFSQASDDPPVVIPSGGEACAALKTMQKAQKQDPESYKQVTLAGAAALAAVGATVAGGYHFKNAAAVRAEAAKAAEGAASALAAVSEAAVAIGPQVESAVQGAEEVFRLAEEKSAAELEKVLQATVKSELEKAAAKVFLRKEGLRALRQEGFHADVFADEFLKMFAEHARNDVGLVQEFGQTLDLFESRLFVDYEGKISETVIEPGKYTRDRMIELYKAMEPVFERSKQGLSEAIAARSRSRAAHSAKLYESVRAIIAPALKGQLAPKLAGNPLFASAEALDGLVEAASKELSGISSPLLQGGVTRNGGWAKAVGKFLNGGFRLGKLTELKSAQHCLTALKGMKTAKSASALGAKVLSAAPASLFGGPVATGVLLVLQELFTSKPSHAYTKTMTWVDNPASLVGDPAARRGLESEADLCHPSDPWLNDMLFGQSPQAKLFRLNATTMGDLSAKLIEQGEENTALSCGEDPRSLMPPRDLAQQAQPVLGDRNAEVTGRQNKGSAVDAPSSPRGTCDPTVSSCAPVSAGSGAVL